ncbi:hypothetical protein T10_11018 [Trichinella papuae]|uniref:Uncharacterized protein n=1 Tax=Trichinella papuae TaxID=268474 RepID=A0A0V1M091_9BILA|nr:hypothetical protein T10_11018 [Trichinella papuae]
MYIEWRCKCVDGCRKGKANAIISMDKAISGKSTCLNRSRQFTWRSVGDINTLSLFTKLRSL